MMKTVKVVAHDPKWKDSFETESRQILAAFGKNVVAIHHIGSTSIPNIFAKPVIDILVEAGNLSGIEARNVSMVDLGYQVMGEFGIPGRRYFRKDDSEKVRTHQVHVFEAGSEEAIRHLAFRDYLKANPADANAYSELKRKLAKLHANNADDYINGKDAFIKDMDQKAALWFRTKSLSSSSSR
jgi:GrpB-like predicted nucleotidyltransferase (UPF0157 family)